MGPHSLVNPGNFLITCEYWLTICRLYPPEILPLSIRAKGASLSTATNWAFNWLVGEMTPILQEWIQWRLYLLHAFFCAVSFVVGKSTFVDSLRCSELTVFQSGLSIPRLQTCAWKI